MKLFNMIDLNSNKQDMVKGWEMYKKTRGHGVGQDTGSYCRTSRGWQCPLLNHNQQYHHHPTTSNGGSSSSNTTPDPLNSGKGQCHSGSMFITLHTQCPTSMDSASDFFTKEWSYKKEKKKKNFFFLIEF